jgi:hypothetical protein
VSPRRRFVVPLLPMLIGAAFGGCFSDRPSEPSGDDATFAEVEPVLVANCATSGCHGTLNPNPAPRPMVLAAGQAYDNIVNVASVQVPGMQRIRPGQPQNSYLIHKLDGSHTTVGGSGSRMPLGRAPLSEANIDLIRRWVAAGAGRN